MSPLLLMAVLAAEPACFVPRDHEPGWKQVTLPAGARTLAAPAGVDQFRSGDPVELVDEHPGVFLRGSSYHSGRTAFDLTPGTGACTLEVVFTERLKGAKVDVTGWGSGGRMMLLNEERVPGSAITLRWGDPGLRSVTVTVHDHFRDEPVIESWKTSCTTVPSRLGISEAYGLGHSLYYLQPVGPAVPLCNKPAVPMRVQNRNLPRGELPVAVSLRLD